jgi:hypothetical protein
MADTMYGVLGFWKLAEGDWDNQVKGLREQVVPRAPEVPGFVAGYWLATGDRSRTFSLILLEGEKTAHAFKDFVESNPLNRPTDVTLESLVVTELVAEASRPMLTSVHGAGNP